MTKDENASTDECDGQEPSIGVAWMEDDGTIKLQLRAAAPGVLDDALLDIF